jgi:mevalonate pyrophosphate decarboxylase
MPSRLETSFCASLTTTKIILKFAEKDFTALGEVTEASALKMHGTTLAANPPFTYWSAESMKVMNLVRQIRSSGLPCYFTMDAGPNVKILVERKNEEALLRTLPRTHRRYIISQVLLLRSFYFLLCQNFNCRTSVGDNELLTVHLILQWVQM